MIIRSIAAMLACLSLASPVRAQGTPPKEGAADEAAEEPPGQAKPSRAEQAPTATEGADTRGAAPAEDPDDGMASGHGGAGPRTPPYALETQKALRQVLARDLDGAADTLRQAIQREPRRPEAHYYLGVTRGMQDAHEDAIASLETAARMAEDDVAWRVRALVGVARILERVASARPEVADDASPTTPRIDEPQLERAHRAWQRVRDLGDGDDAHPLLRTAVSLAAEQQRAIEELRATEERTVPVRERIAEREREQADEADPDDG